MIVVQLYSGEFVITPTSMMSMDKAIVDRFAIELALRTIQ